MVKHDDVAQAREDASKAAAGRLLARYGKALERLDVWVSEAPDDERLVVGLNMKVRYDTAGDVLIVLKANTVAGPVVAFHVDFTPAAAITGLVNRLDNGSLNWREDIPYAQKESNTGAG